MTTIVRKKVIEEAIVIPSNSRVCIVCKGEGWFTTNVRTMLWMISKCGFCLGKGYLSKNSEEENESKL